MSAFTVGFIGAGNMGYAILKGAAESPFGTQLSLHAYDPDAEKCSRLAAFGVTSCASGREVLDCCKFVFLAIKPQMFDSVLEELAPSVTKDTVLVSIAAGITAEYIRSKTIPEAKVILVMPNTPLLLGEGAVAMAKCEPTTAEEFNVIRRIFEACGMVSEVPEQKMKEIIAINGSSPAFIYLYAKAFVDYAAKEGIAQETALPLFAQSLIGSAKMLTDSGYSIEELIRMVSSPGGTTLAGLEQLYAGKLEETVDAACTACTKRAYELSK